MNNVHRLVVNSSNVNLSSSAMLVDLSISFWEGRRANKQVAEEIEHTKGARAGVVSATTALLADCEEHKQLKSFRDKVRKEHLAKSLPWSDSGQRIISNLAYFDHVAWATQCENEFNKLVDIFVREYEWEVGLQQASLGALFDPSLYPSAESIRSKFSFSMVYSPVPESTDFRVAISNEAQDDLRRQYERAYTQRMASLSYDLWGKLEPVLNNLVARLEDRTDKHGNVKAGVFRDTLVSNVEEVVALMRTTNLTDDPEIKRVQAELEKTLRGVTPQTLRNNASQRALVRENVEKVIASLPSLDF